VRLEILPLHLVFWSWLLSAGEQAGAGGKTGTPPLLETDQVSATRAQAACPKLLEQALLAAACSHTHLYAQHACARTRHALKVPCLAGAEAQTLATDVPWCSWAQSERWLGCRATTRPRTAGSTQESKSWCHDCESWRNCMSMHMHKSLCTSMHASLCIQLQVQSFDSYVMQYRTKA